ncbi:bone morphogenetic protein 8A [Ahaetulla prasina]|uniref:bone morphogenetic protein 8A n=1 Tax=Ahaetulla prasina TaxID=499056 RepID=UPI00264786D1|nr:bone morphogenetic protein 8A [Ahaetulla prasina]
MRFSSGPAGLLLIAALLPASQPREALARRPPPAAPRRLNGRELQREVLALLGLPGGPRRPPPAPRKTRPRRPGPPPAAAPLFMLGLYRALARQDDPEDSPALSGAADGADTVMSFVNLVELDRGIFQKKPYWKEFRFDLTQIPTGETVMAAEFRIYKMKSYTCHVNQTLHLSIYEVIQEHPSRESKLMFLDLQESLAGMDGWLTFDVTAASNHWLLNRKYNLGLRLYVETEDGESVDPGLAGLLGRHGPRSKQPFVVTFFQESENQVRLPRAAKPVKRRPQHRKTYSFPHSNRLPGLFDDVYVSEHSQICRRHELNVKFQDFDWLDWVIAPQSYPAFYCDGECVFPLNSSMNATNHAIVQSLVHLMKPESVPKACCAPTKLSAIFVLFYDSNNNVILRKKRNMVVKSCGCH